MTPLHLLQERRYQIDRFDLVETAIPFALRTWGPNGVVNENRFSHTSLSPRPTDERCSVPCRDTLEILCVHDIALPLIARDLRVGADWLGEDRSAGLLLGHVECLHVIDILSPDDRTGSDSFLDPSLECRADI